MALTTMKRTSVQMISQRFAQRITCPLVRFANRIAFAAYQVGIPYFFL